MRNGMVLQDGFWDCVIRLIPNAILYETQKSIRNDSCAARSVLFWQCRVPPFPVKLTWSSEQHRIWLFALTPAECFRTR